jgi:hypothetical protein
MEEDTDVWAIAVIKITANTLILAMLVMDPYIVPCLELIAAAIIVYMGRPAGVAISFAPPAIPVPEEPPVPISVAMNTVAADLHAQEHQTVIVLPRLLHHHPRHLARTLL